MGGVTRETAEKAWDMEAYVQQVRDEEKIQMKPQRTRTATFYQSQMRKERKKRAGINCEISAEKLKRLSAR